MVEAVLDNRRPRDLVPTELRANAEYRKQINAWGKKSEKNAAIIRRLCREDIIFFVNAFVWTLDPVRYPNAPERPFIAYPKQVQVLDDLEASIGHHPLVIVKSRDVGMSWMGLMTYLRRWLFMRHQKFLVASWKMELVDCPKNEDALLPKIDFALRRLPGFMRPVLRDDDRALGRIYNPMTESIIKGTATTGAVARSTRNTGLMLDEFSHYPAKDADGVMRSIRSATGSTWFMSTPNGPGNAFYRVANNDSIKRIHVGWEHIPFKGAGRYQTGSDGKLEVLDKVYSFPSDYKFILDGMIRSPWWDQEEAETGVASIMAAEHGMDFMGSGHPFFNAMEVNRLKEKCREADHVGNMISKSKFVEEAGGRLRLWLNVQSESHRPQNDRVYVIGCDVSAGTGASNSVASVGDCRTRQKVAEFVFSGTARHNFPPHEFAELVDRLGRWFEDWMGRPALVIWENQGPGISFSAQLKSLGYDNLFYEGQNPTDENDAKLPGYNMSSKKKPALLRAYGAALNKGQLLNPSLPAIEEMHQFQYMENGKIEHSGSRSGSDPSGASANHGDRPVADALMLHAMDSIGLEEAEPDRGTSNRVPMSYPCLHNDLLGMAREREQQKKSQEGWLVSA